VLPGGAESFAALSVDPFGAEWRLRFDAVLAQAAEVRTVRPLGAAPDEAMIELADEVAMGAAVMNARRLESRPVQLVVVAGSRRNGCVGRGRTPDGTSISLLRHGTSGRRRRDRPPFAGGAGLRFSWWSRNRATAWKMRWQGLRMRPEACLYLRCRPISPVAAC
jgi:hypothetical protein